MKSIDKQVHELFDGIQQKLERNYRKKQRNKGINTLSKWMTKVAQSHTKNDFDALVVIDRTIYTSSKISMNNKTKNQIKAFLISQVIKNNININSVLKGFLIKIDNYFYYFDVKTKKIEKTTDYNNISQFYYRKGLECF